MTEQRETGWHEIGSTMYRGPMREHVPCPSEMHAYLAVPDPAGAVLRCGLLDGHIGSHMFHMEWSDPVEHGPDWTDSLPGEPSCRCGHNGTPEDCAADRKAAALAPQPDPAPSGALHEEVEGA